MHSWGKGVVLGTVAACLALAGALPASAATGRHWRAAYHVPAKSYQIDGVAAPSRKDAWAFGVRYSGGAITSAFYLRWAGRRWRRADVPHPAGFVPYQIGSSPRRSVWIVGSTSTGYDAHYVALVNNGGAGWSAIPAPGEGQVAVLSARNVWMLTESSCSSSYGGPWTCSTTLARWNGTAWQTYTLPVDGLSLAGAGRHVWLTAASHLSAYRTYETGREAVYRWSGGAWRPVPAPDAEITGYLPAGASPSGKLWMLAENAHAKRLHLDFWNGRHWSRSRVPGRGRQYPNGNALSYDGHDGFWVGSEHWTGKRWVQTLPPAPNETVFGVTYTAPVPGTASVWGVAQASRDERSVLAIYGRRP